MSTMELSRFSNRLAAGLLAGTFSGILVLLFFSATQIVLKDGTPGDLRLVAATFVGEAVLLPSAGSGIVAAGLGLYLLFHAVCGGIFGIIAPESRGVLAALLWGAGLGASLWFVFLPEGLNRPIVLEMQPEVFFIAYLIWGSGLLVFYPLSNRFESSWRRTLEKSQTPHKKAA